MEVEKALRTKKLAYFKYCDIIFWVFFTDIHLDPLTC